MSEPVYGDEIEGLRIRLEVAEKYVVTNTERWGAAQAQSKKLAVLLERAEAAISDLSCECVSSELLCEIRTALAPPAKEPKP